MAQTSLEQQTCDVYVSDDVRHIRKNAQGLKPQPGTITEASFGFHDDGRSFGLELEVSRDHMRGHALYSRMEDIRGLMYDLGAETVDELKGKTVKAYVARIKLVGISAPDESVS